MILTAVVVGFPALQNMLDRARIQGFVFEAASLVQKSRFEAIKGGWPVVVRPDFDSDELVAFANVDNDPGFGFDPDDTKTFRTVDYEIGRALVPTQFKIYFWGPDDKSPEGEDAVVGLTSVDSGPNVVVLLPDGSVQDPGALRIADERGNFLEVGVGPRATGKVQVRKYHRDPPWGDPAGFFPAGRHDSAGVPMWEWY